jgi:enamine deaminase RidA (YjgF/YER057c/UK114 family)
MDAMKAVLKSEDATWDDVVRANVFLLDMADRDGFNETYMQYFEKKERMPTRRLIGAVDMFKKILVEMTPSLTCATNSPVRDILRSWA